MIYGVFADVHSNLEALTVVLDFFKAAKVDGYICGGDMVGYGPEPNACMDRIRGLKNLSVVCGNHDLAAVGLLDVHWFNPYARAGVIYSRDTLTEDNKAFITGFPARRETSHYTLVHGTPRKPAEEYLLTSAQFKENMSLVHVWPLFIGHSHMPLCFRVSPESEPKPKGRKSLRAVRETADVEILFLGDREEVLVDRKPYGKVPTAFNPGAVGQPRDEDIRACCALYDTKAGAFKVIRLPYDVAAVQEKIRKAGLPEFLALRLTYGQ